MRNVIALAGRVSNDQRNGKGISDHTKNWKN